MSRDTRVRFSDKYPLLHASFHACDSEERERVAMAEYARYDAALACATSYMPLGRKYLASSLHDSDTISVRLDRREFTLCMDDFHASSFAWAMCNHFDVRIPRAVGLMPLEFRFRGLRNISISWINRNAKMLPLALSRYLPKLGELLYDEAICIEPERFALGMLFVSKAKSAGQKDTLLLEVDCDRLEIVETQWERLDTLFADDCRELIEGFKVARTNRVQFDYCSSLEFIRNHYRA